MSLPILIHLPGKPWKKPTRGTTVVTIISWPKMTKFWPKLAKIEKHLLCRRIHLWWQLGSKRPQKVLQLSQLLFDLKWPKLAKIKKYLLCRRIHLWWQLGSKRPQEVLQLSQGLAKISHLWVVRSVNMRNRSWPAFEIARINWAVKKSAMYIWTSWCYCSVKKKKINKNIALYIPPRR